MSPMKAEPADTIATMRLDELRGQETEQVRPEPPELSPAIVRRVVADLHHVEDGRGYTGIAHAQGVTTAQVRAIDRARRARIAELLAAEEPQEPGGLEPKE